MPQSGKRASLTREHFSDFEKVFGKDPLGGPPALKKRKHTGESGRFRKFTREFTREWIAERDDSLDISRLKDDNTESAMGPAEWFHSTFRK